MDIYTLIIDFIFVCLLLFYYLLGYAIGFKKGRETERGKLAKEKDNP